MPTIIDSLLITIGLDPKGIKTGEKVVDESLKKTKSNAASTAKAIEAEGAKAAEFFTEMKRGALELFAVLAGGVGITAFVEGTVRGTAALYQFSQSIGKNVEEVSAWQNALRRAGGTAEDGVSVFKRLTDIRTAWLTNGTVEQQGILAQFGISSPADLDDISGAILNISDRAKGLKDQFGASIPTAWLQQLLGVSNASANAFERGAESLNHYRHEAILAGVVTDEQGRQAQKTVEDYNDLKTAWEATGRALVVSLLPSINMVLKALNSFAAWAQRHPTIIRVAFLAIAGGIAAITVAMTAASLAALGLNAALAPEVLILTAIAGELAIAIPLFENLGKAIGEIKFGDLWRSLRSGDLEGVQAALAGVEIVRATPGREPEDNPQSRPRSSSARPNNAPPRQVDKSQSGATQAINIIRQREGFSPTAYPDTDQRGRFSAYRVGYGSDTATDPRTGRFSQVRRDTVVTREAADADLQRRVTREFLPRAKRLIGDAAWGALNATTQGVLVDLAYNGRAALTDSVVGAAKTGDSQKIADAIAALAPSAGVNKDRRLAEAGAVRGSIAALPPSGATASASTANDNRRTYSAETTIQNLTINAPTREADAIAGAVSNTIGRFSYVAQANTGAQ